MLRPNPLLLLVPAMLLAGCEADLPDAPAVAGPACASAAAADFASPARPLKTAEFNGMSFRRAGGHVSCKGFQQGLICWMSAPNLLHVRHEGRDWWWRPGPGERVVLVKGDGPPRCVLDAEQTVGEWAAKHMGTTCHAARVRSC